MSIWPHGSSEMASRTRSHAWASTPLRSSADWSERFKIMVEQVLGSPLVSSLVCGPDRILIYNDAAARLYGDRHPSALGRSLPSTFPETWPMVASLYERSFAGESVHVPAQPLDLGAGEVFDAYLTPVRDEAGAVIAVHMVGFEISDRLRVEAALQASEERLARALEGGQVGAWELDLLTLEAWRSPQHDRIFGYEAPLPEWTYDVFLDHVAQEDRGWVDARFQDAIAAGGRWSFECRVNRADGELRWIGAQGQIDAGVAGRSRLMKGTVRDITARKQGEITLRASVERQAILLKLSDALRPLRDVREMRSEACRLLGVHLSASRAYYVEYRPEQACGIVADDYLVPGLPSLAGHYPFEMFRSTYERIGDGRTWVIPDVAADDELPEQERAFYAEQGVLAWIDVPLAKDGVLEAALCVVQTEPRGWTALEIDLVEETAERMWSAIQRGRIEAQLRDSEERFAQFAASSSNTLWIRDAATLAMEYVSPAAQATYGAGPATILGDVDRWAELIVPEDRSGALAQLELAQHGEATTHEFRVRHHSDGHLRWIRNTDFPLYDQHGRVQRVGGIAVDVTDAKRAADRQDVLINELQHRARNLLAIVASIAGRTIRRGGSVEAFEVRLQALSRAQGLLSQAGSDKVEVGSLVRAELAAHVDGTCGRAIVSGPEVYLTARQVQNFALALHELSTNAVKYGALKDDDGSLAVTWEVVLDRRGRRRLALSWIESGVTVESQDVARRGYGTELIREALAYALEAKVDYELGTDGAHCRIEMPVS